MVLPYVLQAELDSVCEMGLENYLRVQHKSERRSHIEDGILVGLLTTGVAYIGYRMEKLPYSFLPVPFILAIIGGVGSAYQQVGNKDGIYEKSYIELCGSQTN